MKHSLAQRQQLHHCTALPTAHVIICCAWLRATSPHLAARRTGTQPHQNPTTHLCHELAFKLVQELQVQQVLSTPTAVSLRCATGCTYGTPDSPSHPPPSSSRPMPQICALTVLSPQYNNVQTVQKGPTCATNLRSNLSKNSRYSRSSALSASSPTTAFMAATSLPIA